MRIFAAINLAEVHHAKNLLDTIGIRTVVKNEALASAVGQLPFTECQPELWLLSLLLANVAFGLRPSFPFQPTEIICALNVAAHLVWELVAPQLRFAPRLVGLAAAIPFTILIVGQIFDPPHAIPIAGYLLWLAATLVVFTAYRRDLLLVASALLSAIVAITCFCVKGLFRSSSNDLIVSSLLIDLIVIALSAAAAKWLQHLAKE